GLVFLDRAQQADQQSGIAERRAPSFRSLNADSLLDPLAPGLLRVVVGSDKDRDFMTLRHQFCSERVGASLDGSLGPETKAAHKSYPHSVPPNDFSCHSQSQLAVLIPSDLSRPILDPSS